MEAETAKEEKTIHTQRIIGTYSGSSREPLLVVTAGIHGNEPSGVLALQRIFEHLQREKPAFRGTFVGIAGNEKAITRGERFIDKDLNRVWTEENINAPKSEVHEFGEMAEIISVLDDMGADEFEEKYFLDCHTTSSESLPYASVNDQGKNLEFTKRFPVYSVKGFSKLVNGTIDNYLCRRGFTGFVLEAGEHHDKASEENQEAVIWLMLSRVNCLDFEDIYCFPHCVEILKKNLVEGRKDFEINYRHSLEEDDEFKMKPGFVNFEKIELGDFLAVHNGKEILSKWEGRIFMPLYQKQGNDGFFIVREIKTD